MQTVLIGTPSTFWEWDWLQFLFDPMPLDVVKADACAFGTASVVIYADSDGRHAPTVQTLLERFTGQATPVCLVHLSDEFLSCPINFYDRASVVVRNYYRPAAAKRSHVMHVPLGYKSGFTRGLVRRPIQDRHYRWFFAGEVKNRWRRAMLTAADRVPGGRVVMTRQFDDPAGLGTAAYAAALADAVYAPCPRGNDSVDCFRVYEALEAGAIPIVEDDGRFDPLLTALRVPTAMRSPFAPRGRWTGRYRALFGHRYWRSMFGPDFALPRVHDWQRFPEIIATNDAEILQQRCGRWWNDIKQRCRAELHRRLGEAMPINQGGPA